MKILGGLILKTWREECGVFGIWNHDEAARLAYLGLYAQQHRGQESAGVVSLHEGEHIHHKGLGLVGDVFKEDDLERLKGRGAVGHVRYSTTGNNLLTNAQPLTAQLLNGPVALAHNGNFVNSAPLREKLKQSGAIFSGTNDTECVLHLLSKNPSNNIITALTESASELQGAYSMVILTHDKLIAMRDPYGFRPLVKGYITNESGQKSVVIASETCAFDLIGATFDREIEPGELFWVDKNGEYTQKFDKPKPRLARCIFEHVYFARPDSLVFGKSVYEARKSLGAELAKETGVDADVIVPVPDSGVPAALGYSTASGIPFELGIIRNHYVGRTFIQPSQSIRSFGVKIKLNPQSALLKGKRVVVIDDSLVRGTTSQKIIGLVRAAGAKEVHMRIACPPTTGPCFYGVDTPQKSQLIAANSSIADICKFIGADSLGYLSIEGLLRAVGEGKSKYCTACFDGDYPTPLFGLDK